MAAERAAAARKEADKLACDAWNKRMLAFKGPAQPSPALGDALNAGYGYLEVRCLGQDASLMLKRMSDLHGLQTSNLFGGRFPIHWCTQIA
jgi:hypothetical protein